MLCRSYAKEIPSTWISNVKPSTCRAARPAPGPFHIGSWPWPTGPTSTTPPVAADAPWRSPGPALAYLPRHRRRHDPGQAARIGQPPRRPIARCPPPRPCGRFAPTTEAFGRRHVPSRAQPRRRSIRCFKRLAAKTGLKNQSASPGLLEFPPASGGPRSRTAAAPASAILRSCVRRPRSQYLAPQGSVVTHPQMQAYPDGLTKLENVHRQTSVRVTQGHTRSQAPPPRRDRIRLRPSLSRKAIFRVALRFLLRHCPGGIVRGSIGGLTGHLWRRKNRQLLLRRGAPGATCSRLRS